MTIENWIDLLVPVIGIIVAAVSAGATYYFAKKQQISIMVPMSRPILKKLS